MPLPPTTNIPGPTGVIVLKKIADDTYEQYGAITLSAGSHTQVTVSGGFLQRLTRTSLELNQVWFEDFFSRTSQSQNNANSKGWPSGSWQSNGAQNVVLTRTATVSGAVALTQDSTSATEGLWAQLDGNSGGASPSDGRTNSNVDRQPTYYLRWAQASTSISGVRALGWQGVTGSRLDTTQHGIFMKHEFDGDIKGVCRSSFSESSVSSGVSAANGVYHNGKIVVRSVGSGVALIIGEYTGDGTADRSIDVTNYTPECVWVFGRRLASGSMSGSIKIRGMADGVCHPWTSNPTTADGGRSNGINTLTSTGFTIKSNVNASGDKYMYICFPPVAGFSEAGSYTGNGWGREGSVQLDTTTPGLIHVTAGNQFIASDAGQTIIRIADGAVIATVTSVINGANANGVVSLATIAAPATWRFVPRQIPLSFAPDFGMLLCTERLNVVNQTPVQFGPGAGLSDDISNITGTTVNFVGGSISPRDATIQTNSAVLEVSNEDPGGTAGMNGSGKTYHYYIFKTGSNNIRFAKIDYTGDGAASRTISSGDDFQPGFWMGFGQNDVPKWKATPSDVLISTTDFAFLDGNTLIADNITFAGNGTVNLGAGDLNVLNTKYRSYIATGSERPGGSSVDFYLDNTFFGTITQNVPTVDLKPSMSTATTSGIGMNVDYMGLIQSREAV